jgi:hypothetical protein
VVVVVVVVTKTTTAMQPLAVRAVAVGVLTQARPDQVLRVLQTKVMQVPLHQSLLLGLRAEAEVALVR